MSSSSPPRRQRRFGWVAQPLSLQGTWEGIAFGVLSALALVLLYAIDATMPHGPNLGSLGAAPVLAAVWLLSREIAAGVGVIALGLRVLAVLHGILYPETAIAQSVDIVMVGLVGRVAAEHLARNQNAAARAELVSRVARIATSSDRLNLILYGILDEMCQADLGGALIALMDESNQLYPAAVDGSVDRQTVEGRLVLVSGLMQRAAVEGRSIREDDLGREVQGQGGYRPRSVLAVPLRAAGSIVGVIELDSAEPGHFHETDAQLVEQIGVAVSGAVQRAGALQLADELLRRRVKDLELLLETARALSSSLDLDHLLAEVVRSSAGVLGHSGRSGIRASIFRIDGDMATFLVDYDEQAVHLAHERFPVAQHRGLAEALARNTVATWDFTGLTEEPLLGLVGRTGVRSGAFAPIRTGNQLFGVLSCASRDAREFETQELRLLEGIADLAGLAISNSQRLDVELSRTEQLRDHAERMQALERTKSEFLRLASHELRGPIAILRGYISMLNEGTLGEMPEPTRKVLPLLTEKVTEMNHLIDQMLETARLEDTRLQLHLQLLDLVTVVESSARSVETRARTGGCQLQLELPEGGENGAGSMRLSVLADPDRLSTILVNLLDNAIKYSPEGGLIQCRVWEEDGRAFVSVADQGLGIAHDDLPRLFTRFGRIVTPDNSHIPGTGLGLYLSRELARMHGGDITVTSEARRGTTFVLSLPLAVERLHRLAATAEPAEFARPGGEG